MRWTGLNKMVGGALVCGFAATAMAADAPARDLAADVAAMRAEMQQLRQANQDLRQEVTTLRGDQNENWLNERRAEEVKALVHEVLADADTRASLLETGMTAGHNGKNFFLASEDGSFSMTVSGQIQARYVANWNEAAAADNHRSGMQMRRAKLAFAGHIADPRIGYRLGFTNDRNNNNTSLEEALLSYKLTDELSVRGGRYKAGFAREENLSSTRQMAVERSSINETFNVGWTEGVGLVYTTDTFRASVDANDGARSGEAGGPNDFNALDVDFALTGRVDIKLLDGQWGQWGDFATWSNDPTALFIGGGVHYQQSETGTPAVPHLNVFAWTVDSSFHWEGLTLYGAAFGAHDTKNTVPGVQKFDDYGIMAQVGYFVIPDKLQPFFRYELMMADDDRAPGVDDVNILTFGANYFFAKHNAKFTLDVVWALDSLNGLNFPRGAGFGGTGAGLLADVANAEDQVALRAQFQLLF